MHRFTILFVVLTSLYHSVVSQDARFNTSVIPVIKDNKTSLHKVPWSFRVPQSDQEVYYLLDLDAPFTWKDCVIRGSQVACGLEEGCRFPVKCDTKECKEARNYINPVCPSLNTTTKNGCNKCVVTPSNPVSKTCKLSQLTTDLVNIPVTNGRNLSPGPNQPFGTQFVLSCAPSSLLRSFPNGVRGVASFSWSALSFPRQTYNPDQADKFALCLSSTTSSPGVSFLGDGPFYFSSHLYFDLRRILSYTPMIRKTPKSLGYFIKINEISIHKTPISLPSLNSSFVKLSTIEPYTKLRSDIYNSVVTSFSEASKNISRVNAIKPFSYCIKASSIGYIPNIDLVTESGSVWTISRKNLIKYVGNGTSCLALIDAGLGVEDAIVIGTFQMENNLLFFDLMSQKLGFSNSLLTRGTSCNDYDFDQMD